MGRGIDAVDGQETNRFPDDVGGRDLERSAPRRVGFRAHYKEQDGGGTVSVLSRAGKFHAARRRQGGQRRQRGGAERRQAGFAAGLRAGNFGATRSLYEHRKG